MAHELIIKAIVFFLVWFVSALVWSIWFDGVTNPILGCITSLALMGAFTFVIKPK